MVKIDNVLISDAVLNTNFCCNLSCCRGRCCIEGDVGAPLLSDEVKKIEENFGYIKPYMCAEGIETIKSNGTVYSYDEEGKLVTPLVNGWGCAFVFLQDDGTALCAIEKAFLDGKTDFRKPISCFLFPVRLLEIDGLNYALLETRSECVSAICHGEAEIVPLWKFLKDPFVRMFGEEWFTKLERFISRSVVDGVI